MKCPTDWIFPSAFILSVIVVSSTPPVVQSQMIPVSDVITHDLSKEKHSTSSESKVHAKIAEKHLESREDPSVRGAEDDKVTRKDKPEEFQDPAKHASETTLLHFLLEQYKLSGENREEQLEILENLLHFSNKFENGRDLFAATDALGTVLLPALNSSSAEIRKAACSIFGVAGQNNGVVQSKAVEAGVVRHLIQLITFDKEVRPKALFAISSILRNFPDAQKEFVKVGGIAEIVKVAFFHDTRRRSLTFLLDLLNERRLCDPSKKADDDKGDYVELVSDDPCDEEHLLESALVSGGWCELLQDSVQSLASFGTEDQVLVIETVETSLSLCISKLTSFNPIFSQLMPKFESDPDFESTKTQLQNILAMISSPTPTVSPRIEL